MRVIDILRISGGTRAVSRARRSRKVRRLHLNDQEAGLEDRVLCLFGRGRSGPGRGRSLGPAQADSEPARPQYGRLRSRRLGRRGEAGPRASRQMPGDPEALRLVARAELRLGREVSARSIYGKLGGTEAMKAEDLYLLGLVLRGKGERDMARYCWEHGLKDDPSHAPLLLELGRLSLEGQGLEKAARLADRLRACPGGAVWGDLLLGEVRAAEGDWNEAAACWGRALQRDPEARGAPLSGRDYRKRLVRVAAPGTPGGGPFRAGVAAPGRARPRGLLAPESGVASGGRHGPRRHRTGRGGPLPGRAPDGARARPVRRLGGTSPGVTRRITSPSRTAFTRGRSTAARKWTARSCRPAPSPTPTNRAGVIRSAGATGKSSSSRTKGPRPTAPSSISRSARVTRG